MVFQLKLLLDLIRWVQQSSFSDIVLTRALDLSITHHSSIKFGEKLYYNYVIHYELGAFGTTLNTSPVEPGLFMN